MIALLRSEDDAEWLRMRRALWPDCSEEMHRLELAERLASNALVFGFWRNNGSLGGFIEVSVRDRVDGSLSSNIPYVEGWYVDEDLRGKGIGAALMGRAEEWAREKDFAEIASDAELWNEASIKAHKALGFHETFRLVHFIKSL